MQRVSRLQDMVTCESQTAEGLLGWEVRTHMHVRVHCTFRRECLVCSCWVTIQCSKLRLFWSPWRVEKILATKIGVKVANLAMCGQRSCAKKFLRVFEMCVSKS